MKERRAKSGKNSELKQSQEEQMGTALKFKKEGNEYFLK